MCKLNLRRYKNRRSVEEIEYLRSIIGTCSSDITGGCIQSVDKCRKCIRSNISNNNPSINDEDYYIPRKNTNIN